MGKTVEVRRDAEIATVEQEKVAAGVLAREDDV